MINQKIETDYMVNSIMIYVQFYVNNIQFIRTLKFNKFM